MLLFETHVVETLENLFKIILKKSNFESILEYRRGTSWEMLAAISTFSKYQTFPNVYMSCN